MSNQEYCEKLFNEYFERSKEFLSLGREMSTGGEDADLEKERHYSVVKQKWQAAINKYYDFLSLLRGRNIQPNDEVRLS